MDTREQTPLDLTKYGLSIERQALAHGDYSLKYPDLRDQVAIERKSLEDFIQCCGWERKRFQREILALRGYRWRAIVCEFALEDVLSHKYRSKIRVDSVIASIARWMEAGIPFIMAGHHQGASYIVAKLLKLIAADAVDLAKQQCFFLEMS